MTALRCDKCGAAPEPGGYAKLGGSHYVRHTRVSGIGQKPFTRAARCGTWVEYLAQPQREPTP